MASKTSRIEVLRGRPPGYTGIRGSTSAHCSSVRSLGYRWVRIPHSTSPDHLLGQTLSPTIDRRGGGHLDGGCPGHASVRGFPHADPVVAVDEREVRVPGPVEGDPGIALPPQVHRGPG